MRKLAGGEEDRDHSFVAFEVARVVAVDHPVKLRRITLRLDNHCDRFRAFAGEDLEKAEQGREKVFA